MKIEEADNERDSRGCEKMAEMMRTICGSEGGAIDCHSFMKRMMGASTKEETKEAERKS